MNVRLKTQPPCHVKVKANSKGIERIFLEEGEGLSWEGDPTHRQALERWLADYREKREPQERLPLLLNTSPFATRVLRTLALLPFGKTTTYGALAEASGHPKAARAVGRVMNANPFPLVIPCHRVLASNGPGGFALGLQMKENLLTFELPFFPVT